MNLKCIINGKIYNLLQGNTIAEDYSETLDSGSIVLTKEKKILGLDPYDDVYIWNSDILKNFNGVTKTPVVVPGYGTYYKRLELENSYFLLNVPKWASLKRILQDISNETRILFYKDITNNIELEIYKRNANDYALYVKNNLDLYEIANYTIENAFEKNKWYSFSNFVYTLTTKPNIWLLKKNIVSDNNTAIMSYVTNKMFYKHFLIDRFTEQRNLIGNGQNNYEYKIELFSETKGMENIVLPNIKITQPLNVSKRLTTLQYMQQYLELYSPKMKIGYEENNRKRWRYEQKYKLSYEMYEMFNEHYCQEFSLNSPTLRELFTKLMVTKDCIPVVKDNVIYPLCLAKTQGTFLLNNASKSFITANKSSDGYMTSFRTNYSNALSPNTTCHMVEQMGFRNSDEAVMTIENMRIETSFPIYKLNKVYMCYYKKCTANIASVGGSGDVDFYFLCKQDITKLCVLNNERQALYKDTRVCSAKTDLMNFMKDNYYFTLGYSIGSNLITGFGEKFSYVESAGLSTWDETECIIRNIWNNIDRLCPFGIDGEEEIRRRIKTYMGGKEVTSISFNTNNKGELKGISVEDENGTIPSIFLDKELTKVLNALHGVLDNVATASLSPLVEVPTKLSNALLIAGANTLMSYVTGDSLIIKGLTFEIDYQGFYNGAVKTNKEIFKNEVMKNDNQSESMPYLDLDGEARERKIQKMGNKSYTINARYEHWDEVQDVGTIFTVKGEDENQDYDEEIIIYHKEVSIYDKKIDVIYYGQESFVLKNFYTSVFAKQRLFNVLDYGSSLTRAENVTDIIYMSKSKLYKIAANFNSSNLTILNYLNFQRPTWTLSNSKIDQAMLKFRNNKLPYLTDVNTFIYGNSICFNVKMFDNITMGTNIDPTHLAGKILENITENGDDNYKGTSQTLCAVYDDYETGRTNTIQFILGSSNQENALYGDTNSNFQILETEYDYDDIIQEVLYSESYHMTFIKYHDIRPIIQDNEPYSISDAKINVAKWQLNRLYYPLISDATQLPLEPKITFEKTLYKDANEIIDMTFQTQFMIDKKDNKDIFFSNLALRMSDLVGNVKKNNAQTIPTGKITFIPFQLKYEWLSSISNNYVYGAIPGIIVKIPNDAIDIILATGKELNINYELNIATEKANKIDLYFTDNKIIKYKIKVKSIYLLKNDVIRVNCDYIEVTYLDNNDVSHPIKNNDTFIYLHSINTSYIREKSGIDKTNFTYYTNINFAIAQGDPNLIVPYITHYYEDEKSEWEYPYPSVATYSYFDATDNIVKKYVLSPNDTNYANTAIYGYDEVATEETIHPQKTYPIAKYKVTGQSYNNGRYIDSLYLGGNIYGYFSKAAGSNDNCILDNNSNKILLQYTYQASNPNGSNLGTTYGFPNGLQVFQDYTSSNYYYEWDISTEFEDIDFENKIICVGGKEKIETSLIDKKISTFTSDFGDILRSNGVAIDCEQIIKVVQYGNGQIGYIKVDLANVPNVEQYQSIQEWIFNKDIQAYEFVCGFNINAEERENNEIIIYLSMIGNLDLQIYNENDMLIGKVYNRKDEDFPAAPNVDDWEEI